MHNKQPEGSFLIGVYAKSWCLCVKLAPMPTLDLPLFAPRSEVGAYILGASWCLRELKKGRGVFA
jgi:hypothetical protein